MYFYISNLRIFEKKSDVMCSFALPRTCKKDLLGKQKKNGALTFQSLLPSSRIFIFENKL